MNSKYEIVTDNEKMVYSILATINTFLCEKEFSMRWAQLYRLDNIVFILNIFDETFDLIESITNQMYGYLKSGKNENLQKIEELKKELKKVFFTSKQIKLLDELKNKLKNKCYTKKYIDNIIKCYEDVIIYEQEKKNRVILYIADGEEKEIYYIDNKKVIMFDRKQV